MDTIDRLLIAIRSRLKEKGLVGSQEWSVWTIEKWLNKLSEEQGELCECYNKSLDKKSKEEELADVIIVSLIIADKEGIDIKQALIDKFNKTSVKRGAKTFIVNS